ncbi:MAG: hypothetical protein ACREP8_09830 [Candidatus Binatia bacterium]
MSEYLHVESRSSTSLPRWAWMVIDRGQGIPTGPATSLTVRFTVQLPSLSPLRR